MRDSLTEHAPEIVAALRCCGNTDTKRPDCEHCPMNGPMCVKRMLEGAADALEVQDAQLATKDKQLAAAVEESDFRKHIELTPLYTCGGHGYPDDDDEDFWCPICRQHLGTHRGFETTCPRCRQEINSDGEPCWDYDELRRTEYDQLPKNWERGVQEEE